MVAKGEGEQVGWPGSLRLTDANYRIWSAQAMGSCCVTQGTLVTYDGTYNVRKKEYVYVCVTG